MGSKAVDEAEIGLDDEEGGESSRERLTIAVKGNVYLLDMS